jgi:hypothetical protein
MLRPGLCYAGDVTIKRLDHVSVVVEGQAAGVRPAILAILLMPSNDSGSKRSRNSELQASL